MCAGVAVCARNGAQEIAMSESVPILSEFMTIEELAAELGRNKRTLDRWDALGIGPPRTRVGRTVLYRRSSVQKWLVAQEHQAGGL
jgi:predicted DNA-binding transcriptional regulator AlpA